MKTSIIKHFVVSLWVIVYAVSTVLALPVQPAAAAESPFPQLNLPSNWAEVACKMPVLTQFTKRWVFIMNFDMTVNDGYGLPHPIGCMKWLYSGADNTNSPVYPVVCNISGRPKGVTVANGQAVFNGTGFILCPFELMGRFTQNNLDLYDNFWIRTKGSFAASTGNYGNPIFYHADAAYFAPTGTTVSFLSKFGNWEFKSEMGARAWTPLTLFSLHSKETGGYNVKHYRSDRLTLAGYSNYPDKIQLNTATTPVYIGYSPLSSGLLKGIIEELIVDPAAGMGN